MFLKQYYKSKRLLRNFFKLYFPLIYILIIVVNFDH